MVNSFHNIVSAVLHQKNVIGFSGPNKIIVEPNGMWNLLFLLVSLISSRSDWLWNEMKSHTNLEGHGKEVKSRWL